MSQVTGFPPVIEPGARVLILGSMPVVKSLEMNQYYALPHNAFWKIMGDLFDASQDLAYAERLKVIASHHIGLWDVLENCYRPGSLDSAIETASARPNDFKKFFRRYSTIRHVFFNGKKASDIFFRRVLPDIEQEFGEMSYRVLPSTSPAHASMSYEQKLKKWSALEPALKRPD